MHFQCYKFSDVSYTDTCHSSCKTSEGEQLLMQIFGLLMIFAISTKHHWKAVLNSNVTLLLFCSTSQTHEQAIENFLNLRKEIPAIWCSAHCFHFEKINEQLKRRLTASIKTTKHSTKAIFDFDTCVDHSYSTCTGANFASLAAPLTEIFSHSLVAIIYTSNIQFSDDDSRDAYCAHQNAFKDRHMHCDTNRTFTQGTAFTHIPASKHTISTQSRYFTFLLRFLYIVSVLLCVDWFFLVWFHSVCRQVTFHVAKLITVNDKNNVKFARNRQQVP